MKIAYYFTNLPCLYYRKSRRNSTSIYSNKFLKQQRILCCKIINHAICKCQIFYVVLEEQAISRDDIEAACEFYGDWNSADIVRERQLLFARLSRMDRSISVTEICKEMQENRTLADMAPNFVAALKTYIDLPSSACEAEQSFSTLRRLKTVPALTQTQQHLNDLAILNTHRNHAEALDLAKAVYEFVSTTQTCRNKFGLSS